MLTSHVTPHNHRFLLTMVVSTFYEKKYFTLILRCILHWSPMVSKTFRSVVICYFCFFVRTNFIQVIHHLKYFMFSISADRTVSNGTSVLRIVSKNITTSNLSPISSCCKIKPVHSPYFLFFSTVKKTRRPTKCFFAVERHAKRHAVCTM